MVYERNATNVVSAKGLNLLKDAIAYGNLRLVILDSFVLMSGEREEVYEIMDRLRTVAKEQMVAVVAVRNLSKPSHSNPAHRGIKSMGWGGVADSILVVTEDAMGERALAHYKSHHAPLGDPIGFVIDHHGCFGWTRTDSTNAELLGVPNPKEWTAERTISGLLASGPLPGNELLQKAMDVVGAGQRIVEQARARLKKAGIITSWRNSQGRYMWGLPEHAPSSSSRGRPPRPD